MKVEMQSRAVQTIKETPQALISLLSNGSIHQAGRRQIEILDADYKPEQLEGYIPQHSSMRRIRTY